MKFELTVMLCPIVCTANVAITVKAKRIIIFISCIGLKENTIVVSGALRELALPDFLPRDLLPLSLALGLMTRTDFTDDTCPRRAR